MILERCAETEGEESHLTQRDGRDLAELRAGRRASEGSGSRMRSNAASILNQPSRVGVRGMRIGQPASFAQVGAGPYSTGWSINTMGKFARFRGMLTSTLADER